MNVALTACSELIVTAHVPVPLQLPPDQPLKVEPAAGEADNVTIVPSGYSCEQVPGQSMPPPVTVPEPVPLRATLKVCEPVLT